MARGIIKAATEEERKYYPSPEKIYHYTSPAGLLGMISNVELWFSRFDCLNDAGEGLYIIQVYKETLASLEGSMDSAFLEQIQDVKPTYQQFYRIDDDSLYVKDGTASYNVVAIESIPYICCFSENEDSLPMWNYYSKSSQYEGYNVGFVLSKLKESIGLKNVGETANLKDNDIIRINDIISSFRVIYNKDDQITILKNHIDECCANHTENGHPIEIIRSRLASVLSTRGLQFKDPAFQHEQEFRMIYWRPSNDTGLAEKAARLNYRVNHGLVIPYIKCSFAGMEASPICSITVGPMIQNDVALKTVKCLLDDSGIKADVDYSRIPIRY